MSKNQIIEAAKLDRETFLTPWQELKRKYPQLTIDEIFCDVIGQCNSQRHLNAKRNTKLK